MFQVYLVENDTPLNHMLSLYLENITNEKQDSDC